MRSFNKRNHRAFGIFGVLVLMCIGALSFIIYNYASNDSHEFTAYGGSVLYDEEDALIQIEEDTVVVGKWDKKYYLKDSDGNTVCLGKNPVVYNEGTGTLSLIGPCYRIYPDGSTQKYKKGLDITDFSDYGLYKLSDRVYVITGKTVSSYNGNFAAENFIKVSIDRNGNSLLQGSGLNSKTMTPVILNSGDLYLDIASELLYCNGMETNLRKVIGSSNEYSDAPILYQITGIARPAASTANQELPDIEYYEIVGGTGGVGGIGGTGGSGGHGGFGGIGGTGGYGGSGGIGGSGGSGGNATENTFDPSKYLEVTGIETAATSFTLSYALYDPSGTLAKVILRVTDEDGNYTNYQLPKYSNQYSVYALEQNKNYTLELFYCEYIVENGEYIAGAPVSAGTADIKTAKLTAKAETISLANDTLSVKINLVGMNLDTDGSSKIVLLKTQTDGTVVEEEISLNSAALTEYGQRLKISVTGIKAVEIKKINGMSNGVPVEVSVDYYRSVRG